MGNPSFGALMSLRGLGTLNAATLVAEPGRDLHRFEHPSLLMGYLGLVPSEATTGDDSASRAASPKWATALRGGP